MNIVLIIYIIGCIIWVGICCTDNSIRAPFKKGFLTVGDLSHIIGWVILGFVPIIGFIVTAVICVTAIGNLINEYKDKPIITFKK